MNREQLRRAFATWALVIDGKMTGIALDGRTWQELAESYGKSITTPDDLRLVAGCFDFDRIDELIESCRERKDP